jgi:hypothetical protein
MEKLYDFVVVRECEYTFDMEDVPQASSAISSPSSNKLTPIPLSVMIYAFLTYNNRKLKTGHWVIQQFDNGRGNHAS